MGDTRGHNDSTGLKCLTFGGLQLEAAGNLVDRRDVSFLQCRHEALLKLEPIGDESFAPNGDAYVGVGEIVFSTVVAERKGGVRVVKAGCKAVRLEQHALGHVLTPALHGSAEDAEGQLALPQMGSN